MAIAQAPPQVVPARPVLSALGLLALVVAAVIGGDPFRVREHLVDRVAPTAEAVTPSSAGWAGVVSLQGTGTAMAAPFSIGKDAIRWRVRWRCRSQGHLVVTAAGQPAPVIDAFCPGAGAGFASRRGAQRLRVSTDGPWKLEIEQQRHAG